MEQKNTKKFAFFGTSELSVIILDELKAKGFIPSLVVTVEDKPKGRKLVLTPPETKVWAEKMGVPCIQPKTLRVDESVEQIKSYAADGWDFFVVASYGKIIPQSILDIPRLGTLNVHPSLLPKLRGASPIVSAILAENETGVTIMRLDADMDHGPIVAQAKLSLGDSVARSANGGFREKITLEEWPPYAEDLESLLAHKGGEMLANVLPDWLVGKVVEHEQDHNKATFVKKIEKSDGEINLTDNAETNLRKIRAYHVWPTAYFFQDGKRIIIKRAHIENQKLVLERIVPEGKKEMDYKDFVRTKEISTQK